MDIKSIALEFFQETSKKYQGCPLGVGKSGNCSWFAKDFHEWASKKYPNLHPYIILFVWGDREEQGHIVPVLGDTIIDYIREFVPNSDPFLLSKIGNLKPGEYQISALGGAASHYSRWYDTFVAGNSVAEVEQHMKPIMQRRYGSRSVLKEPEGFKVGPFEAPKKGFKEWLCQTK